MKNLTIILLFFLFLSCTTTKVPVVIEDEWNLIISNDDLLGEWQCDNLSVDDNIILNLSFSIDDNQNFIFTLIINFEKYIDKEISDLRINYKRYVKKDEIWEYILSEHNNLENVQKGYSFGNYYMKRTFIFLSSENREKKLDNRLLINQFGNKIKLSMEILEIGEGNELIFKKI